MTPLTPEDEGSSLSTPPGRPWTPGLPGPSTVMPRDDLSPLFRSVRERMGAQQWDLTMQAARKPPLVQTPDDISALVHDIAPRYNVDPRLVESVIGLESGGKPGAVSIKGAQGIMQLMPATQRRFNVTDPMDPAQNIEGGVRYLSWLAQQFPGRTDLQLAAYHAGEGAVRRAGYAIPPASDGQMTTQQYVQTIMSRYQPTLPGEEGKPGLDVSGAQARQAVRTGTSGPPLQVETDVQRLSQQGAAGKPTTAPAPLPGQGGMPGLDVSRDVQRHPMDTGAELQVETGLRRLGAGAMGQPTTLAPGQRPFDPEHPNDPGLIEDRGGRIVGGIGQGAVESVHGLLQSVLASEQLAGLGRTPTTTGSVDPMGVEFLTGVTKAVSQAVAPRLGGESPDFVDKLSQGIGTSLISLLPGAAAERFLRGISTVSPSLARFGAAVTSGVIEGAGEAGNLYEELVPLIGADQAARRALWSFAANTVLVTATDKLGIFGEQANVIRRTLNGVLSNGLQGAVQYDIERRQLWVPTSTPEAQALLAQGWQQDGDRISKPFVPKDMAEAALISMVIGGPAAAMVSTAIEGHSAPWDALKTKEAAASGGTVDPAFTVANVFEAAQHPEHPAAGVEPSMWQRWSTYLRDLLPETEGYSGVLGRTMGSQRGSTSGPRITLEAGAQELTPETYRTPQGRWSPIALKDMPSTELELQDFLRQQGGVKLEGEELQGELAALISRKETGLTGLQNNASGLSLQHMAEKAAELGFIPTADKTSLLDALDRSVTQSQPVYSHQATGKVALIDDPYVRASYQAVMDASAAMQVRTEEQVAGVRHRPAVHAEAAEMIESGQFTHDDVRDIYPNTTLNDTMTSALVQSLNTIGEQMALAAQDFLDGGERLGSATEQSLQQTMALLAELDPIRLGVSAAQSRGLGILNDPLSQYTQFLNGLHEVLATAPGYTMGQIARRILAARPEIAITPEALRTHPELMADILARHHAMIEEFQSQPAVRPGFMPATQRTLIDEYQDIQRSLTEYLAGRASADQAKLLQDVLQPWRLANPQEPLLKAMVQATKPGFQEYFLELWFNALLSNPATHAANALSNTVTTIWAVPERFLAEQFGMNEPGHVARGESTAMLYGLVHGLHDAWSGAYRSWQMSAPVSGLGRETTRDPAWTAQNLGLDPQGGFGQFVNFFFEYIGAASGGRLPTRALMASDEFFKILNYRMELNALAYREATKNTYGYHERAWGAHVARVIDSPNLGEIQQAAKDFGVIQTFQNELTPGGVGAALQGVSNIAPKIKWTDQTFPVGRIIVPFIQTPANIARYAMERTPLGAAFASHQADIEAGGARADMAHAKVSMGTMAMLIMAGLAMKGHLVGRGPEDPELRAIWLQSHPEYSFRPPGTNVWIGIDRLDPTIGMLGGMVADIVQIAGESEMSYGARIAVAPIYGFLKNILSRTYMQGLNQFFDAMSTSPRTTPGTVGTHMAQWLQRRGAGLLQPSALLAATARVLSPEEVEAKGLIDMMYARIPGWGGFGRSGVPARRTLGGEKVLYGYGFDPAILANTVRAYWPMKMAEGVGDPVDREILAHRMQLGTPPRSLIPAGLQAGEVAQADTAVDMAYAKPLPLTSKQYEKLSVLASGNQEEARKLGLQLPPALLRSLVEGLSAGMTNAPPAATRSLYDYLDWLRQQPEYQAARPGHMGGKERLFQRAVLAYQDLGKQLLLAQDPELQTQQQENKMQRLIQQLPLGEGRTIPREVRPELKEGARDMRRELGLTIGAPN